MAYGLKACPAIGRACPAVQAGLSLSQGIPSVDGQPPWV